jgi:polyribonucleotide nucleotidyltransferase
VGDRKLVIETGKLAGQANGAVTVRYGDTVVLVTVCSSKEPREGVDFLPLTVDYEERLYAAGKIPGGFIRREGRPSEEATLTCRLTDRPLRPLLPKEWRNDIQLVVTVLSVDQESDPDILSIIGSSAVLSISDIPFDGPVSAIHIGYINNELVLNPTFAQLEDSQLNLVVASTKKAVVMLEAGAQEVSEEIVTQAIKLAHEANQAIISLQEQLQEDCGKPKVAAPVTELKTELTSAVSSAVSDRLPQALNQPDKSQREEALSELKKELGENLSQSFSKADILAAFDGLVKTEVRSSILSKGRRVSGRGLTEIRPISCEIGILSRIHGSALFTRGETQALTLTTLGSARDEQKLDGLGLEETRRFIHHYNFSPFSVGEVKRIGTPSRREIGHGALAARALMPVIPPDDTFPYTIRLVSEILSSSGSTSMASACASSLSLMDAGVPISSAVAGISLGLVTDANNYAILTDIEGFEDNYGDMDYKVAGTREGITAIQLDTKLKGISLEILEKALYQGRQARLSILEIMQQTIGASRPEVSHYAPRMHKMTIDPDKIGAVIGSGGKTIRSIIEETKTTIDVSNDGSVMIGAVDAEAADKAIKIIEDLTKDVEIGAIYTGKVVRLMTFGAFVEILPGKDGLVHISELADYRVERVEDIVKVGDEVTVKVIGIDSQGRINLSRRVSSENNSQPSGTKASDSLSADYPFRSQRDRPSPQRSRPPINRQRH